MTDNEFTHERAQYLRGLGETAEEVREMLENEPMGHKRNLLHRLATLLDELTDVSRELLRIEQSGPS